MAQLRLHNRKSFVRFLIKKGNVEETCFLEPGKFIDMPSKNITEDIFNKIAIGQLKMEVIKNLNSDDFRTL